MFTLEEYISAQDLEQAAQLLEKDKKNVILGGLLWMKMGRRNYHTGIDLSRLSLDGIAETDTHIEIGCMTTLRQVETSALLADHFGSLLSDAVSHIVGVQFRNCATMGGSVFSKSGFSDILTALTVLDTTVELHRGGSIPLETFLAMPPKKDILVRIRIKKRSCQTSYQCHRMSATDFSVLNAAVCRSENGWNIAVGARPARAAVARKAAALLPHTPDQTQIKSACNAVVEELTFGANSRGSKAYREKLATVLVKRGIESICKSNAS